MKKKSIVIATMENSLSPYGFSYSGYESLRWTFSRDMNGNIQYVVIQKSNWGDCYYLEIFTSTNQQMLRVPDITGNPKDFQCLYYHNKEEQVEVLKKLANIVICYGLDILNTLRPIKTYEITREMNCKLFDEKNHLTQRFLERSKLESLDDEKVLQTLQQEIEKIQGKEYEQVQDKLIEMAAVYGNLIIESMGGEWVHSSGDVYIGQIPKHHCEYILCVIIGYWKEPCENTIVHRYLSLLIELYKYLDKGRRICGLDWLPDKPYRGLLNMTKLDKRRPWAIQMVERYGMDYEGDKTILEY